MHRYLDASQMSQAPNTVAGPGVSDETERVPVALRACGVNDEHPRSQYTPLGHDDEHSLLRQLPHRPPLGLWLVDGLIENLVELLVIRFVRLREPNERLSLRVLEDKLGLK